MKESEKVYGSFIHEVCSKGCACSYCVGVSKLHYGLNIPPHWNCSVSWYVIKYGPRRYLCWTNRWLKRFGL